MPQRRREPYLIRHPIRAREGEVIVKRYIRLPEELSQTLARIGDERHLTANRVIVEALEAWVKFWEASK